MARLGLSEKPEAEFLAALDAAAEAKGTRALVLVDAINEGAGSGLWRNEIGGFLTQLRAYKHVACVISCRTEYKDLILPRN